MAIPYMGSKRKLAPKIIDYILQNNPNCKYIYDLFGGGAAISIEALKRPQFEKVYYNELNAGVVELLKHIRDNGITPEFYEWVDRETFLKHKNDDTWYGGYLKTCWSFGNNQNGYLYGDLVEPNKKLGHYYVVNRKNCLEFLGIDDIYSSDYNKRRAYMCGLAKKKFDELHTGENVNLYKQYKKIMYRKYTNEDKDMFTSWLRGTGITAKEIDILTNTQMGSHYTTRPTQKAIPTKEHWELIQKSEKVKNIPEYIQDLFCDDLSYKHNKIKNLKIVQQIDVLGNLDKLQHMINLQRLQHLERLEHLNITNLSYDKVVIDTPIDETVIYCDQPYKNTATYQENDFCHDKFLDWAKNNKYKVYVSSYEFDLPCVLEMEHCSKLSATANNKVIEKLFCNREEINYSTLLDFETI